VSNVSQVAKASVTEIGRGVYIASLLPSATIVLSLYALIASHLYPWAKPIAQGGARPSTVSPGIASIVHTTTSAGPIGYVLLVLGIAVGAFLLRPFQVSVVQFLEGYWTGALLRGLPAALAIERHRRIWSVNDARRRASAAKAQSSEFEEVAAFAARAAAADRIKRRGIRVVARYPGQSAWILPTLLGNHLRRAETTAGERYGLKTVITYPRLRPHLSDPVDRAIAARLAVIDNSSMYFFIFGFEATVTGPLLARLDGWSLISPMFCALAGLCYRGARVAARAYGLALATAYDLHRFDMLKALHLRLPGNLEEERDANEELSRFLEEDPMSLLPPAAWDAYEHEGSEQSATEARSASQSGAPSGP